jgi:hypothetical protein
MSKWIVARRNMFVHRVHHVLIRMSTGDFENARMPREDTFGSGAQAAGDDDAAVLLQSFADGVQRFIDGRIDEATGVDHDHIRSIVGRRDLVALGAQARQDPLRVNERLGAAEADESDFWRTVQESALCARRRRAALQKGPPC